ncbi:MAG: chemotaxis protein CheX [Spirochaetota bacterium]
MSNYRKFSQCLERSVKHIFTNLFGDSSIDEVFDENPVSFGKTVMIEMDGTVKGALRIQLPEPTIRSLAKTIDADAKGKKFSAVAEDVAGEMGNLIAGTLVNQLQYINHSIKLFPPEFGDDLLGTTALYENVNMTFRSSFGAFVVDLYYKEK